MVDLKTWQPHNLTFSCNESTLILGDFLESECNQCYKSIALFTLGIYNGFMEPVTSTHL